MSALPATNEATTRLLMDELDPFGPSSCRGTESTCGAELAATVTKRAVVVDTDLSQRKVRAADALKLRLAQLS